MIALQDNIFYKEKTKVNYSSTFFLFCFFQLLYQDVNVGVEYQYSVPKKFSQQSDPDVYAWVSGNFSECNVTCGGGMTFDFLFASPYML